MMYQSIATIDSPEFINLQPLEMNPLMSSCEIKVLYLGKNRNNSYISKEVATEMAKTLRGAPIVGYYKENKEDFADHGEKIIFDDEGIKFECMTKPYGFVAPDAKVWFQKFEDTDEFGNIETREYLMTTGYLWTGQYEECKSVIEEGKGQSMELDPEKLDGHWATDNKTNMDFFIINDAIFSKLCILGDDVEPCFEGASITAPQVSTSFTKIDENFKKTLYNMMQDLKFALKEGGKDMVIEDTIETIEDENKDVEIVEENTPTAAIEENNSDEENNDNNEEAVVEVEDENTEVEEIAEVEESNNDNEEENDEDSEEHEEIVEDNTIEDEQNQYSLLQKEFNELKDKYSNLENEYNKLYAFKIQIDNEQKDNLIKKFYMLSDEDKKDVIENKEKYSLEDIEAKLSVICFRKKVNFDSENNLKNENKIEDKNVYTYNINSVNDNASIPNWVRAVKDTKERKN